MAKGQPEYDEEEAVVDEDADDSALHDPPQGVPRTTQSQCMALMPRGPWPRP